MSRVVAEDPERPWYEPGIYKVVPDVYRVPLPLPNDGLRAVNAYILRGSDALTVIDPGAGLNEAGTMFDASLAKLDLAPEDVAHAVVTHIHYDHYTRAVAMRRRFGTTVWIGSGEAGSFDVMNREGGYQRVQHDVLRRFGAEPLAQAALKQPEHRTLHALNIERPDRWLDDADAVPGIDGKLRVVHTPGHTRGHVVVHHRERAVLFAGDHVLPTITPSIGFEPAITSLPLADYLRSLLRVRELPDATLLPAHGAVTNSVHARVDELLRHHDWRLEQARRAIEGGAATGLQAAMVLSWTRRELSFDELDPLNQMLAVLETGFHLDVLVDNGVLTRGFDGLVAHYLAD